MKWERIGANWERMQVLARERWPKLTGNDVDLIEGDREELLTTLEHRYGWDHERAEHEVLSWEKSDTQPPSLNRPYSLRKAG